MYEQRSNSTISSGTLANAAPRPRFTTYTKTSINWGSVVKGVAIVTAVAVAAVAVAAVVGMLVTPAASAAVGSAAANPLISSTLSGIGAAGQWITGVLSTAVSAIAAIPSSIVGTFGLGTGTLTAADAAATVTGAKVVAAGATVAVAAVPAIKTISAMDFTHQTTVAAPDLDPSGQASILSMKTGMAQQANMATHTNLHEMADMAHHAAHNTKWADRFTSRTNTPKENITPRSTSFADQLNAETSNLINTLSK